MNIFRLRGTFNVFLREEKSNLSKNNMYSLKCKFLFYSDFVVRSIERKKAAASNQVDKEPSVKSFIK